MSIGRICSRQTHLADADESALSAARRMKSENVGTLVVVDDERKPAGIFTDRDLLLRVVADGLDPERTAVRDVMTANPRTVFEGTPIEEVLATMRTLGVRRMPVVDGFGKLVGLISVDDVLELLGEELSDLGRIFGVNQPGAAVPARA